MKRTEILCPECMKKKLLTEDDKNALCDECGNEFTINGLVCKYKKESEMKKRMVFFKFVDDYSSEVQSMRIVYTELTDIQLENKVMEIANKTSDWAYCDVFDELEAKGHIEIADLVYDELEIVL